MIYQNPQIRIHNMNSMRLTLWKVAKVKSPFWRFYYSENAGAEVTLSGKKTELLPDSFYLIPPNTTFSGKLKQPVNHFYIHFSESLNYTGNGKTIYRSPLTREIKQSIRTIQNLLLEKKRTALETSLESFYLLHTALRTVPIQHFRTNESNPAIAKVVTYMEQNLGTPITNPQLARIAGLNVNAFIEQFREAMGTTPKSHLISLRLNQACVLLANTNQAIETIAEEVGFCHRYHFSRIFRKWCHVGPAAYRKRQQQSST